MELNKFTENVSIYPAFKENNIPIIVNISDFYVPYFSVLLLSIIDHSSKNNNYDLIVFEKEISTDNKSTLNSIVRNYRNFSLRFVNVKNYFDKFSFRVANDRYCPEAFYRMFTPWILNLYDTAIAIDCDAIVKDDIALLYQLDISKNYLVGAVKDVVFQGILNNSSSDAFSYSKNVLNMKSPYSYVNTGVLILKLNNIRNEISQDMLLKVSTNKKFRIQEQDIINMVFDSKICFLDIRWNYYIAVNSYIDSLLKSAPTDSYINYKEEEQHAKIIHWANSPKPWEDPSVKYASLFWNYATNSPFYYLLLSRLIDARIDARQRCCNQKKIKKLFNALFPINTKRRSLLKIIKSRFIKYFVRT